MGKFFTFIVFAIAGFWISGEIVGPGAGEDGGAHYRDVRMEGCMRQMRQVVPGESFARGACDCMFDEFEARGVELTDAFGSDFDDMSSVTRQCAARYGATLPN